MQAHLLNTKVFSDTMFSETTSVRGKTCAQVFATDQHFVDGQTMKSKSEAYQALDEDWCTLCFNY